MHIYTEKELYAPREGKPFNFDLYPFEMPPHPSQTDPNWESYSRNKRHTLRMEYLLSKEAMSAFAKGSHAARDRYLRDLGYRRVGELNNQQESESPQRDLPDRRRVRRNKKQ